MFMIAATPVATLASGPVSSLLLIVFKSIMIINLNLIFKLKTNSMRGASALSDARSGNNIKCAFRNLSIFDPVFVIDVGGTTTEVSFFLALLLLFFLFVGLKTVNLISVALWMKTVSLVCHMLIDHW